MDLPDTVTRRRALLGGLATLGAGGGVVYGASRLGASGGPGTSGTAGGENALPPFRPSTGTTGFGVDLAGTPVLGSSEAGIDLYYWSEYQCPFCRQFEDGALPKLIERDVRPGDLRVAFLEFPYMGKDSMTAAVMDRCVWRQVKDDRPGVYWRWRTAVFAEQGEKNGGWASKSNLLDITAGVDGVDRDGVASCVDERRSAIEPRIEEETKLARRYGFRGTPSFVMYDRSSETGGRIVGAQPYENFEQAMTKLREA